MVVAVNSGVPYRELDNVLTLNLGR